LRPNPILRNVFYPSAMCHYVHLYIGAISGRSGGYGIDQPNKLARCIFIL
jgi:hypothetical protein